MREGSLEAPTRHPVAWNDPAFTDPAAIDAELRRIFDICHGCRRCFNLCDSFPRLFDLVDNAPTGELDSVDSKDFKGVVDACTLCDMCFMTKCPYVPPHAFNLDFPHLMLRYRVAEAKAGMNNVVEGLLSETDRNGKMAGMVAPLANWAGKTGNRLTRPAMEKALGVHRDAHLPKFHGKSFSRRARTEAPPRAANAPALARKAALYATCFVNYNNPDIGMAALGVLAKNGVDAKVVYPRCCGMPQLERGEIERVAEAARAVARDLAPVLDDGYDIVALMPSCALMMKFEWPLIVPDDPAVKRLAKATFDISEYVVDIARKEGMAPGMQPLPGGVTLHLACHSRAQNMGPKAAEMLRLIPGADVAVIERCSGHGGSWGVMKENFEVALKVGRPVVKQAIANAKAHLASECPLAGAHIVQGMQRSDGDKAPAAAVHPIQLLARAYGLDGAAS